MGPSQREELDGGGVDGGDGVTGEVDRIVGERGAPGSPERQVCVRWLNWSGDPTWNDAATVIKDVPHVMERWLRERESLWPGADVKEVEQNHAQWPSLVAGKLVEIRRKQMIHSGDRSHLDLQALDAECRGGSGGRIA